MCQRTEELRRELNVNNNTLTKLFNQGNNLPTIAEYCQITLSIYRT